MATLIAWIKKAYPYGRREAETDKADSGDEINEADAANRLKRNMNTTTVTLSKCPSAYKNGRTLGWTP